MNTNFRRIMERKLRASDRRIEKAKLKAEAGPDYLEPVVPPLLVTLNEPLGELPSGYCLQMPNDVAIALIHMGHATATPVGSFDVQPHMAILTEEILRVCLPPALFDRLENLCEVDEVPACI
jgi:hypothetical protein